MIIFVQDCDSYVIPLVTSCSTKHDFNFEVIRCLIGPLKLKHKIAQISPIRPKYIFVLKFSLQNLLNHFFSKNIDWFLDLTLIQWLSASEHRVGVQEEPVLL